MTLLKQIEQVRQSVDTWESMCVSQASTLVSNFRKERIGLQREWFNQMARRGSTRGSHSIGTWCPLNLFSRLHNGSLQIYWQLVYRDRATRSVGYKHLAKRKAGGYDLRQLLCHANEFERDLVAEYEEEAQLQRERWAQLTKLKHHLDRMGASNEQEGALLKRRRAASAASDPKLNWPEEDQ